jgi:hypothetical protein
MGLTFWNRLWSKANIAGVRAGANPLNFTRRCGSQEFAVSRQMAIDEWVASYSIVLENRHIIMRDVNEYLCRQSAV